MAAPVPPSTILLKLEREIAGGVQHLLLLRLIDQQGAAHGYGLIRGMDEVTGMRGLWKEGTIYPVLAAMEREGLVRSRWGAEEAGPRRKYYELTQAGRHALRLCALQWRELRDTMDRLLEAYA